MTRRTLAARWLAVTVVVAALVLGMAAACGSSDKFEGTWINTDEQGDESGLVIEKDGDSYKVSDPDGSNAFDAKVSADGNSLEGQLDMSEEVGKPAVADITLTVDGDDMEFKLTYEGQSMTYKLTKD